jgi:hypothetical protein
LTNALQQVINSLSVATLATILTARTTFHVDAVGASLARATHPSATPAAAAHAAQALHAAFTAALAKGFDDTFLVVAGLGVLGVLLGLTLRQRTQPGVAEDGEAEAEPPVELAVGF